MKKLLIFIAIPVVVVIAAILALVLLVNPNQFKPLIVEQAQKHTGLELVIEGDISWQFFPSIICPFFNSSNLRINCMNILSKDVFIPHNLRMKQVFSHTFSGL